MTSKSNRSILTEVAQAMRDQQRDRQRAASVATADVAELGPTERQLERASFKRETLNDGTRFVGRAYRRLPLFETMFRRGDINADIVEALRFYRNAHEGAERSETRCALNRAVGGGANTEGPNMAIMRAREARDDCERAVPSFLLDTLRAVGLHDRTFAEVARNRWAAPRERTDQFDEKKPGAIVRLRPPSSRQRAKIAAEFKTAAHALHTFVAPYISTTDGRHKHIARVAPE